MTRMLIDTSNNNHITARELRSIGAVGLLAKATEGTSFEDPWYHDQRQQASMARIPFGGYVFLRPDSLGNEALDFLKFADPRPGDIQPVIDAETGLIALEALRVSSCATAFRNRGYKPIGYGSASWILEMCRDRPELRKLPWIEAQYPGRRSSWSLRLRRLRMRLGHGITVIGWQWTDALQLPDGRKFDATVLFVNIDKLRIPSNV